MNYNYTHLINNIREELRLYQEGVDFRISDLLRAELLCYDNINFLPRFIDRWPELDGSDLWTFSVSEGTIIDMTKYMVDSHWNAPPPERV